MSNQPARQDDPFKGIKTGVWTKWGGGRRGLTHRTFDIWYCQACAQEQPHDFPGFMVLDEYTGEYMKLCAKCYCASKKIHFSYRCLSVLITDD